MSAERAFLSVADKTDLPEFAERLARYYTLLSYGGTAQAITGVGVELGNFRDTLALTLNLPREGLATVIATHVKKRETAKPIGLVCIGIKPLPTKPFLADIDRGGPLIIEAALEASKPALTCIDQYPEAIERLEAGEFHDPMYQSRLANMALERVANYTEEILAQWAPAS